jgi:hypothetical protein
MEKATDNSITLEIKGELGKHNTIPIDSLVKIAQSLQGLFLSIAEFSIPPDQGVDWNNFKLELSGFKQGSAVPSFTFPKCASATISPYGEQRALVMENFHQVMSALSSGNYGELKAIYPEPSKRNPIVESLYEFTSSFGSSPVLVYVGDSPEKNYSLKRFTPEAKKSLMGNIPKPDDGKTEEVMLGSIKVTTKNGQRTNKVQEAYPQDKHSLSYSPTEISVNGKTYTLNYKLMCTLEKEDGYYVVRNEQLDIIGTGVSQADAESSLNEELDFLYWRLNSLGDEQLSERLRFVKLALNNLVSAVRQWF